MLEVMERKIHGPLKGGSNIFETKRHVMIHECTPWNEQGHGHARVPCPIHRDQWGRKYPQIVEVSLRNDET
jgi:hypothetical protein